MIGIYQHFRIEMLEGLRDKFKVFQADIWDRFIANRPGLRKILTNISWLFFDKVLRMGVGLFVMAWVARYLGPKQFGLWNFAIAFTSLFGAFANLGLDGIVVRELVKNPQKTNELLGTAFLLRLGGAIVAFLLSIAGAFLIGNTDPLTLSLIALSAAGYIFQAFLTIDYLYQAHIISKYTVWSQNIAFLIISGVKVILIFTNAKLLAFAIAGLFEVILGSIFLVISYLYLSKTSFHLPNQDLSIQSSKNSICLVFNWSFSKSTAKSLLKDSWPLMLSGITLMIQARIDQVMLKGMIGNTEVGYYSVALRLIETFGFVPLSLNSSLFPALVNAKKISDELYKERLLNYYRLSFVLFLLTAIPIFLFSEKIVILLYGIGYQPAGILLSFMAVRLFFANMGVARSAFINIENLFKLSFITMIIGTITNILLNYYLIPLYKSQGAIVATIISFFVTIFVIDFIYNKTRENVKLQLIGIITFYKLKLGVS